MRMARRSSMRLPGPVLLIIFCCVVYLCVFHYSKPSFVISVQSDPPVHQLAAIVRQQRQQIEYLSTHPKVVFRCLQDEPTVKYPRRASDDLTEIVMNTNDECGNDSIDAIMMVHTSADHFGRRATFRKYYGDYNKTKPYRLKVVFLIGSVLNAKLQIDLEKENMEYGDTVVGSFLDTYQNLTLKAVMGYRWLTNTCPKAKLLIKIDDDVLFSVQKFYSRYWLKIGESRRKGALHCFVWTNAQVGRTGKWKVERGLFANSSYSFPYCAGMIVVVTPDLIKPMYEKAKSLDFFWIDDVFLYGMVPDSIKNVQFVQTGRHVPYVVATYEEYVKCKKKRGFHRCQNWAVLTDGEGQLQKELDLFYPPPTNQSLTVSDTNKRVARMPTVVNVTTKIIPPVDDRKRIPPVDDRKKLPPAH